MLISMFQVNKNEKRGAYIQNFGNSPVNAANISDEIPGKSTSNKIPIDAICYQHYVQNVLSYLTPIKKWKLSENPVYTLFI